MMTTEYSERDIALMPSWMELRQSQDVSLEQIAQRTRISIKKLEALEAHEFESLGDATFAMGYIRAYAKVLGRDPEVFLQVYRDAISPASEVDEALSSTGSMFDPAIRTVKQMSLLQLSVAVIVLWGGAMMLFTGGSEDAPEVSGGETVEEGAVAQVEELSEAAEEQPEVVSEDEAVGVELGADGAVTYQPATEMANSQPEEVVEAELHTETSTLSDEVSNELPAAEEALAEASGEDILIFSFTDECWLEVTDASGTTLIAQLQVKGDNQRVFGQAPFKIMLGNARAATLTLNGEVVSIEPRPGKNTLRFTASR